MNDTETTTAESPQIYKAMTRIMRKIGAVGKNKKASYGDGFSYRGIDDLYNALYPIFCKCGVFIRTVVKDHTATDRMTKSNTAMRSVAVVVDHIFTHEDGSSVTVRTAGEAMDSGDKATAKALSMAMKYALVQTFSIPTAGGMDNERDTFEPSAMAHKQQPEPQQQAQPKPQPQSQGVQLAPAPTPPDPDQEEKRPVEGVDRCHIQETKEKRSGKDRSGKDYTIWAAVSDKGREYDTFSEGNISVASDCCRAKCEVEIKWKRGSYGYELIDIVPMQPPGTEATAEPIQKRMTVAITKVNHRYEDGKDGVQFDVWGVDTNKGRFGCLDADIAVFLRDFAKGKTEAVVTYVEDGRGRKIVDIKADLPF